MVEFKITYHSLEEFMDFHEKQDDLPIYLHWDKIPSIGLSIFTGKIRHVIYVRKTLEDIQEEYPDVTLNALPEKQQ